MKTNFYFKKLCLVVLFYVFLVPQVYSSIFNGNHGPAPIQSVSQEDDDPDYPEGTIVCPAYGQLSQVVPLNEAAILENATMAGYLNSTDIYYIRDRMPQLKFLDISRVTMQNNTLYESAFSGKTSLLEVILPPAVLTIGNYAFYRCSSLRQVVLPDSLRTLGYQTFYQCAALTGVQFPAKLNSIGDGAFQACTSLATTVLPDSLASIGSHAFYQCAALTGIQFPAKLRSIGDRAFQACTSLTVNEFTDSLTSIGTGAFRDCYALRQFTFAKELRSISQEAFYQCTSLKTILFPDSLKTIDNYAFHNCYALEQLNFSEGLQTIGHEAFRNCQALTGELLFPASLTSIGTYAFYEDLKLTSCRISALTPPSLNYDESLYLIRTVYVPETAVVSYKAASYWNSRIIVGGEPKAITLNIAEPGTLGEKILEQYAYLSDVNILNLSGTLNSDDFNKIRYDMPSLLSVDLSGCSNTALPDATFQSHQGLRTVRLPSGLKTIGSSCFQYCHALLVPDFPATLEEIGSYAFDGCHNLYDLNLPASLKYIRDYAFYNCQHLQSVQLTEGLQSIAYSAFQGCIRLASIRVPESVSAIGDRAFYDCRALASVSLPNQLTVINSETFRNCSSLTEIELPSPLTTIGGLAFYNCSKLTRITFPAGLTTIDGYYTFGECTGLQQIICLQPTPPVINSSYDTFSGVNRSTCELLVPHWALTSYKLAEIWKTFLNTNPYEEEIKDIVINSALTMPSNTRPLGLPDVTLMPSGSLTIRGNMPFQTDAFALRPQLRTINSFNSAYPRLISECNAVNAQKVLIEMDITGGKWYYLSFPFDIALSEISIDDGVYFAFRRYDGEFRANQGTGNSWKNLSASDTLRAGTGYIFQCSKSVAHLILPATNATKNQLFQSTDQTLVLGNYPSENPADQGWNLSGNPYVCFYDIRCLGYTAPVTYWNDYNNRYDAVSPVDDAFLLQPFQAFFVQKPNDMNGITFPVQGRQLTMELAQRSPVLRTAGERTLINLELNYPEGSDRTRIVINPAASNGYEIACDAAKFMSDELAVSLLYTLDPSSNRYAINERLLDNGIVAIGFRASASGAYTFSLQPVNNDKYAVFLRDKQLNTCSDLTLADYAFDSDAGTFDNRFELQLVAKSPTGIETLDGQKVAGVYVWAGKGRINVESEAKNSKLLVYSASGALVAETKINGNSYSIPVTPGIYLVKTDGKVFKISVF